MTGGTWAPAAGTRSRPAPCSSRGGAPATGGKGPAAPVPPPGRCPGEGVEGAGAADARPFGRGVVIVEAAPALASRLPGLAVLRLELERLLEELAAALGVSGERAYSVETLQRVLGRHLR